MPPTSRYLSCLAFAVGLGVSGCDKDGGGGGTNAPGRTDTGHRGMHKMDREGAPHFLIHAFQNNDRDWILEHSLEDLGEELSGEVFGDLAKVLSWLGELKEVMEIDDNVQVAGSSFLYECHFEKGSHVLLTVTTLASGELVSFHFEGEDFLAAEHGALDDRYTTFKVYDLKFTNELGKEADSGHKIAGSRIDYQIIVGGLNAELGEHHLSFEKIVVDKSGGEVLHEPVEFDKKFEESPEGIPRAKIQMFLQLDDAPLGEYDLVLKIRDNVSGQELEHKEHFEIVSE
jgi:hypothetical protein